MVNTFRSSGHTTKGASPYLLQKEILAGVLPSALFGSEKWWPGISDSIDQGLVISNRVIGHLEILKRVVFSSARVILPVYKTTPIPILLQESGLLPPDLELDKKSRHAAPSYASPGLTSTTLPGRINEEKKTWIFSLLKVGLKPPQNRIN